MAERLLERFWSAMITMRKKLAFVTPAMLGRHTCSVGGDCGGKGF